MSYTLIDPERIKSWLFDKKVERAIKKANKLQKLTKSKFAVFIIGGKPRVYRKTDLRTLVNKRIFKARNVEELMKHAIHITTT